jgi:hypothetical protein
MHIQRKTLLLLVLSFLLPVAAAYVQRLVQHAAKAIVTPVMSRLLDHTAPRAQFRREDISPFLWANGKVPTCEAWKTLAASGFETYRLKV